MEDNADRYRFMRSCRCIMAASGTATLETGLAGVPTLVAYKVSPFSYWVGRNFLKVKWISLTNLILDRTCFPEHIQHEADPEPLFRRMDGWLSDPVAFEQMHRDLDQLRELCGRPGSARRAAQALWQELV
jgi:lipid-A-disaccharide synthase